MLMQPQFRTVSANQPRLNTAPPPAPVMGSLGAMEQMGSQMNFGPNEEIFGESEPAERPFLDVVIAQDLSLAPSGQPASYRSSNLVTQAAPVTARARALPTTTNHDWTRFPLRAFTKGRHAV
jgi:hypothetical protein